MHFLKRLFLWIHQFPFLHLRQINCGHQLIVSRDIGLHAKTQPNIFDFQVFWSISFFDAGQFGYLGVCMEIKVAQFTLW